MRPTIIRLLFRRSPSAVAWGIRPIIVDSVERVSGWARPHVAQERGEVISPFLAHYDATLAIVAVPIGLRVVTAVLCCNPAFVFRRAFQFRRAAMLDRPCCDHSLNAPASAASSQSSAQRRRSDDLRSAAVTAAEKHGPVSIARLLAARQNDQTAEPLTSQIDHQTSEAQLAAQHATNRRLAHSKTAPDHLLRQAIFSKGPNSCRFLWRQPSWWHQSNFTTPFFAGVQ